MNLKEFMNSVPIKNIEMILGIYGILAGIVFFLYFYIKSNRSLSYWFILSIITGAILIYLTKKRVMNDTTRELRLSEI